ncbi:shikimate kinase [Furfurilactobacillus siliginis]|uniref:Shikimate kinase n=1 Tax=Furfurilactobacillus siliginis TaxID=348151 RepID=A0A0R2L2S4_9LACO|nr:shikimate kinase [Furfurilactobacillus siliginis]KRN95760.1 hypothetical protein IV55_GL001865 [Furfurilactobacillus siliginis]GEK28964.1 shikimate kinase [Furfurilactobacillus siliginis]
MEVVLIGFMGTGKSTIGPLLAKRLGRQHLDLDRLLEARLGQSVGSVFAQKGEAAFRLVEQTVLRDALEQPGVLSTGGGAAAQVDNAAVLRESGATIVLLEARDETLIERLCADQTRPLVQRLGVAGVLDLKHQRDAQYHAVADFVVRTDDGTPGDVVREIMAGM